MEDRRKGTVYDMNERNKDFREASRDVSITKPRRNEALALTPERWPVRRRSGRSHRV